MTSLFLLALLAVAEPPDIVLWHSYRAGEAEALESFIEDLNARETRYRVNVLAVPYDAYLDKLTAAIPRGRGPDLFIAQHDPIGDWAEAGTIAPLDDVVDAQLASSLEDGLVPAVVYQGHAYGVPIAFKSLALWRNTDLVKDAPATLSDLERIAKEQTTDGRYGLAYENGILYYHAPFLFGFGARLFDDDGKPDVASPQAIASLRYGMHLGRDLGVVPKEMSGALVVGLFNAGKAAMMLSGPWTDVDPSVHFATSPLPIVDVGDVQGRRLTPFLTVEAVMVSGRTDQRDLAVLLASEIAGDVCSEARLLIGKQPVALSRAWDALSRADDKTAAFLRSFRAQRPSTIPTPNTPEMKALWQPMDLALGQSIGQGTPPEETLGAAAHKLTGILASSQRTSEGTFGFSIFVGLLGTILIVGLARYRPRKLLRDVAAARVAYLYAAPALLAMGVLVVVPFLFGVGMGFFEHAWGRYTFVGLANFANILAGSDTRFFYTLGITMLWTASNVLLHVVIGLVLALVLSQARLRFRGLYRVLFIIPWAVPSYITALIWKGMFHPELGAINVLLGIEGFSWMGQTWSAFLANLATNTWLGFPFMMVTAIGGLTSIPPDLYEAAALDGAGPLRRFFTITLPLLRPVLAPAVVLGTVWTFNMFNVIYLVSGGAPGGNTDILVTEAFRWAFERGQGGAFGYASAYSSLIFLLLLAYTTAAQRVAKAIAGSR